MRFTVFDRWGNPIGDIPDVLKADRTRATDATDTLDITAIGEINKDERIVFKDTMGRWAEYICQSNDTQRATGIPVTTAYCSNSISELSRTYIEDKRNRNANAAACLSKALEGTRWQPGTVETGTTTTNTDLAFYHCSVLEAIQSIADTYGLEIETEIQPDPTNTRIATRIVHMVEHRGRKTATHRFEYGKDLVDITREVDATDVVTRLYGWGKGVQTTDADGETTGGYGRKLDFADVNDGKKYVEDTNATQNWGIPGPNGEKLPSTDDVEFGDCDDPAELLRLTKAELAKRTQPIVSYTANVAALGKAGLDPEGVDMGDDIQIVDTSFPTPLRLEGRILKIEEDIVGDLSDTTITLGNISQSYTQRLNAQQQALDKLVSNSGAWDSAASGSGPYMRDLIDRINQIMNETGGYAYLVPGQGIYVYDKPKDQNPTQAIQIGGGYWRIADKKKSDGDWDWRSLANGHGIFADTIFTGRLSDAAGLNYWDLDTGEFSLSSRTTVGGQTVDSIAQGKADAQRGQAIRPAAGPERARQRQVRLHHQGQQRAKQRGKSGSGIRQRARRSPRTAQHLRQAHQQRADPRHLPERRTPVHQRHLHQDRGHRRQPRQSRHHIRQTRPQLLGPRHRMHATDIDATGQITSTSGGTSAAIKGGTMTYDNSSGGRFSITNDRLSSGSSWVNLVTDNVDSLVFHNETNDYHASVYVMCGPGYVDTTKLALVYGQFASLDCDEDNDLIISDNGAQINSNGFLTLQCDQLTSGEKLLDFGQGTSSDSDIWLGLPRNSYRPCLRIGSGVCQISCNDVNRVDLSPTYAALVHGDYHVMVNSSGVSQTTRAASATSLQADMLDKRLMALAEEGIDLSDPSGYTAQPAAIDEITMPQMHEILRRLVDGDTDGAKTLLDQYESEQHIWTQAELDEFDVMSKTDHPTGQAQADRTAYRASLA